MPQYAKLKQQDSLSLGSQRSVKRMTSHHSERNGDIQLSVMTTNNRLSRSTSVGVEDSLARRAVSGRPLSSYLSTRLPDNLAVETTEENHQDPLSFNANARAYGLDLLPATDKIEIMRSINPKKLNEIQSSIAIEDEDTRSNYSSPRTAMFNLALGEIDPATGLTPEQVALSLASHGPNSMPPAKKRWFISIFLMNLIQPSMLVIELILGLTVYSMVTSAVIQGADVFTLVAMGLIMGAVVITTSLAEYNTGDALGKLLSMSAPSATVRRGGEVLEIPQSEVVCGDIVILSMGDTAPADLVITKVTDFKFIEAALTGEPLECTKTLIPTDPSAAFQSNRVFASTACVSGKGEGVVTDVGARTQVGRIASQISIPDETMSPLQKTMAFLGGGIILIVVVLIIILGVVMALTGNVGSTQFSNVWVAAFYDALQLSIIVVPATLPLTVVLMMKEGVRVLAEHNVIVRRMTSVETLGSATVICSDKTGTLTEGKMTATKVSVKDGTQYMFWPCRGQDPRGGVFLESDVNDDCLFKIDELFTSAEGVPASQDLPIPNRGCFAGAADGGDDENGKVRQAVGATFLNCDQSATLSIANGAFTATGNMTEIALVVAAAKAGFTAEQLSSDVADCLALHKDDKHPHTNYPLMEEACVPFTSSRKMCATVHESGQDGKFFGQELPEDCRYIAVVKGAPDKVSAFIKDDEAQTLIEHVNGTYASQSLRVILTATRTLTDSEYQQLIAMSEANDRLTFLQTGGSDGGKALEFLCCLGLRDPPRVGVKEAVALCTEAHVRVVMITGDQIPTARAISASIGIPIEGKGISYCKECKDIHTDVTDPTSPLVAEALLDNETANINAWARAQPMDKLAIVESLRRQKHVVVMTGDGVNDAAALKASDIGVSMGIAGTDVAKEASDLILMDDNFVSIVAAAQEGRRLFGNLQKYVLFYLGTKTCELVMFCTCIFGAYMKPAGGLLGLLAALFLTFSTPITLLYQHEEGYQMSVPPRNKDAQVLTPLLWFYRIAPFVLVYQMSVLGPTMLSSELFRGNHHLMVSGTSFHDVRSFKRSCVLAHYKDPATDEWTVLPDPVACTCMIEQSLDKGPESVQWQTANISAPVSLSTPSGGLDQDVADEYGFDLSEWIWKGYSGSLYPMYEHDAMANISHDLEWLDEDVKYEGSSGLYMCSVAGKKTEPMNLCWGEKQTNMYANDGVPFPHISKQYSCGQWGFEASNSVAWMAFMWTELMFLVSVRTEKAMWLKSRRDGGACNFKLWACFWASQIFALSFIFVPGLNKSLGLIPVMPQWLLMALAFALVGLLLNEGFKKLYVGALARHYSEMIRKMK